MGSPIVIAVDSGHFTRGVWVPKGERPLALGHHRYEWLYVYGFDEPATGRTMWNVSNAVCKGMFEAVLAGFAKSIGVGNNKRVVIQLDQAGWHGPQNLTLPDGIRLVFQPSHSPELQPAEHLPMLAFIAIAANIWPK
jgi:hypothetical protein